MDEHESQKLSDSRWLREQFAVMKERAMKAEEALEKIAGSDCNTELKRCKCIVCIARDALKFRETAFPFVVSQSATLTYLLQCQAENLAAVSNAETERNAWKASAEQAFAMVAVEREHVVRARAAGLVLTDALLDRKVVADKADAERDRYRRALKEIAERHNGRTSRQRADIAHAALKEPTDAGK